MTTVVYRDGVLASDSAMTGDGDILQPISSEKIWKISDQGSEILVGGAGLFSEISKVKRIFTHEIPLDNIEKKSGQDFSISGTTVIVVDNNGGILIVEGNGSFYVKPKNDFFAIGSGSGPALGALYNGASAIEAVEIACKIDIGSALPVQSVRFT